MADHIEDLIKTLLGGTAKEREAAAIALGESNDRRAIEPLRRACHDTDHYVREAAKKALGRFGEPESPSPQVKRIGPPEIYDPEREAIKRKIVTALSDTDTTVYNCEKHGIVRPSSSTLFIQGGLELESLFTVYPVGYSDVLIAKHNGKTVFADGQMSDNVFIRGEWEAVLDQHLAELAAGHRAGGPS